MGFFTTVQNDRKQKKYVILSALGVREIAAVAMLPRNDIKF